MVSADWSLVWIGIATILVTVYGFYAQAKQRRADKVDEAQAKLISDLTNKQEADRKADQLLNEKVREVLFMRLDKHMEKIDALRSDVDRNRYDRIEGVIITGFGILANKIDNLKKE
jgi:hypothetical protein